MIERGGDGLLVGHVHPDRLAGAAAGGLRHLAAGALQRIRVDVGQDHVRASPCELHACRQPDRPSRAGDQRDLPRQRLLWLLAQFGLLEAPVLHVEEVGIVERLVSANRLRGGLDGERVLGDVGRDGGVLARLAGADDAHAGDEQHAGSGSSFVHLTPFART